MNEAEALKEILRIIKANGGLCEGQEIKIDYNSGLWRIEKLANEALAKKEDE